MNYQYEQNRIYVEDEHQKIIVLATFPFIKDGVVNVDHTFVDPSLRGQGIASELMHEVVSYAKKQHYKIVATCPYAVMWFKKHLDYANMIDELTQATLDPACQI